MYSPVLCVQGLITSHLLSSQGGNVSSVSMVLHSSAASKLKHLQQNSTDKTKGGKREDLLNTQGQQQVLCLYLAVSKPKHAWSSPLPSPCPTKPLHVPTMLDCSACTSLKEKNEILVYLFVLWNTVAIFNEFKTNLVDDHKLFKSTFLWQLHYHGFVEVDQRILCRLFVPQRDVCQAGYSAGGLASQLPKLCFHVSKS